MSEADTQATPNQQPQFDIQRIYVKDISFETPNSPAIFTVEWKPEINLDINTTASKLGEGVYEVVLRVTATAKVSDKTAFLIEVNQAGIFTVSGFEGDHLTHTLHSYCPNILFPYAREVVSDLVNKGSFPALNLAPINFDALFAQHLARQKKAEAEAPQGDAVH